MDLIQVHYGGFYGTTGDNDEPKAPVQPSQRPVRGFPQSDLRRPNLPISSADSYAPGSAKPAAERKFGMMEYELGVARQIEGKDNRAMTAYERHLRWVNDYLRFYGGKKEHFVETAPPKGKTDADLLREEHRFVRDEEDLEDAGQSQAKRMALKYYNKLFKEFCIADMSKYRTGQIGLRWRLEKEVLKGKGQFVCGNKRCSKEGGLTSFEVPFQYSEAGEQKETLVKLRLCERCGHKLMYKKEKRKKKEEKKKKRKKKEKRLRAPRESSPPRSGKRAKREGTS